MKRTGRTTPSRGVVPFVSDLDTALLQLPHGDSFTARNACDGVHIWGGIGSGKTSGSGKALAAAYLRAGWGGLVCCAKPEEVELWERYARANGRAAHLVHFDASHGFNVIAWELKRSGMRGISNVTEMLMRVLEAADLAMGQATRESEAFWSQAIRQVLNYAIPVLYSAWGKVTVSDIIDFVTTAATDPKLYADKAWVEANFAGRTLRQAVDRPAIQMEAAEREAALEYWCRQYPAIPQKTLGNIVISLTTKLDRFKHGRMKSCFCERTTVVPEITFHGAVILMCMPALTWNEDGVIGQQLFKFCWQRAVESRNGLDSRQRHRPVFLWCDESQYFVNLKDAEFISTCRGSRACVVFMTQTVLSYTARLGEQQRDSAESIYNKLNTHIFHLNACARTGRFASDLIGRDLQWRATQGRSVGSNISRGMNEGTNANRGRSHSYGSSYGGSSGSSNSNTGSNEGSGESYGLNIGTGTNESESWSHAQQMDNVIEPRFFASELLTGGPKNRGIVTGVWFRAGARFASSGGRNFTIARFRQ